MRGSRRVPTTKLALAAALGLTYHTVVRPRLRRWGATDVEVTRPLPGDDLAPGASGRATHAITIAAPVHVVWAWIAQLGWGRGGFYSYNWLENLCGADLHNADEIHPEWCELSAGDVIWAAPPERFGDVARLEVASVEPDHALVLGSPARRDGSWAFVLEPVDDVTTRLVVRWQTGSQHGVAYRVYLYLVFEPVHFVMERGMLVGLARRAERDWARQRDGHPTWSAARVAAQGVAR